MGKEQFLKKTFNICMTAAGGTSVLRMLGNRGITILMYHRVVSPGMEYFYPRIVVKENDFGQQMEYIARNYNAISLDELHDLISGGKDVPRNTVVITFDDGYMDNLGVAYPILRKHRLPFAMFLATNYINSGKETRELQWPDKLGYVLRRTKAKTFAMPGIGSYSLDCFDSVFLDIATRLKKYPFRERDRMIEDLRRQLGVTVDRQFPKKMNASWEKIRMVMGESGLLTIGAHTHHHAILSNETLQAAREEITASRREIRKHLGIDARYFCYPNGEKRDYSPDIIKILREEGFLMSFSTTIGANTMPASCFELKRIPVNMFDSFTDFRNKLVGVEELFLKVKRRVPFIKK